MEALFGCRETWEVPARVGAPNVLLYRAIGFGALAPLAADASIGGVQRADHFERLGAASVVHITGGSSASVRLVGRSLRDDGRGQPALPFEVRRRGWIVTWRAWRDR